MKFYLSSFRLGNKADELVRLLGKNKKIAYIPNACDFTNINWDKKTEREREEMDELRQLGLEPIYLDLKIFFGKIDGLRENLNTFGGVFVRGGNTFILRQAMRLSGFDLIFQELLRREDFVYAGYSAGICVLASNFDAIQIVDNPEDKPYPQLQETIWEGLGYLEYMILPHYQSDHPESPAIDQEVENCKAKNIPYKTIKDGEVIIIE